jgi:hypothetical protein
VQEDSFEGDKRIDELDFDGENPKPASSPHEGDSNATNDQSSGTVTSLDRALINFQADLSPWKHPHEWLCASRDQVNSIALDIATLTDSKGFSILGSDSGIYQVH